MQKQIVFALLFIVLVVLVYFMRNRDRETYVLPNFATAGTTSNICPDGYVLVCVSSNLYGISETIPFPDNLPKPCDDPNFPSIPLCLPHPRNLRPPTNQSYIKKS